MIRLKHIGYAKSFCRNAPAMLGAVQGGLKKPREFHEYLLRQVTGGPYTTLICHAFGVLQLAIL